LVPILKEKPEAASETCNDLGGVDMKTIALLILCATELASASSASAADYELKLVPNNTHTGAFDAGLKPVLRIASGDTVTVEAVVSGGMDRLIAAGASDAEIPDSLKALDKYMKEKRIAGGTLTGPIYVEGAQTGDALEVQILPGFEFLHPYGWTGFRGKGTLPDDFPYARYKLYRIDVAAGTIAFAPGITIKTSPFWGTIGVAPPVESGRIPNGVPGAHAGNLDFKELVPGSALYIPVHVPGALLSIGDGHAVQADGEINGGALETSLRGSVRVLLRKGKFIKWPRAETPTHFITMGPNTDLDEAARMAVREMIDYLVAEKGLTRDDAYNLCSQAVDLHVTQLVDGVKGVHAMIAKSIFH
jgi:acetamidase/formamidase